MSQSTFSIVIACGGTGGHLFPGISVAQTLKEQGHRVTLLISEKQVDSLASSKYGDLDFRKVPAIAMPRIYSPSVIPFGFKLLKTIKKCRRILDDVQADAVLGMGGFTSFPPIYAASRKKIPAFIHESNALPGKANRWTARWCRKVLVGVHEAVPHFSKSEPIVTGTPIRMELMEKVSRETAAQNLGLDPTQKTILVMGGSQGARNLNSMVVEAALQSRGIGQFLIIAGTSDYERVLELTGGAPHIKVVPFCSDMGSAYACADVAISRSGASSLTELAYFGIPSLLVPYPFAADDHQAVNAQVYCVNGAGKMVRQNVLDPERIISFVNGLLTHSEQWKTMSRAAKENSVPDAANQISQAILSILKA